MLDLTHHPRVELVMYLSQIDHVDHAMTQTMANRPRTEVGRPILPGLLLSFVLLIQTRLSQIMPDIYWL